MLSKLWIVAACGAAVLWAQPANQTGIAHVAFRVSDLDAARAFYGKLGFDEFFAMKDGEKVTESFVKINDRQFIELYPKTAPTQALGLMHVCYESNDLEALHTQLAKWLGPQLSTVRKAGAGNMLMTTKDPEGQTIEYTQYMPGSRHYEDRGQHLGAKRVAQTIVGASAAAHDPLAISGFYIKFLGFTKIDDGTRLRMPGDSGQVLDIVPEGLGGVQFGVGDLKKTAATLAGLGLKANSTATAITLTGPDGAAVSFVKK